MAYKARRAVLVTARMADSPGLAAEMLRTLRDAGINLLATLAWVESGQAVMGAVPEDPNALRQLAMREGINITETPAICLEGDDAVGALVSPTQAVASAGVSLASCFATAAGGKFGAVLVPREADYEKACAALGI